MKIRARHKLLPTLFMYCSVLAYAQEPQKPVLIDFDPRAWQEFSSPEGRFSVQLPGIPKKIVEQPDSPVGKLAMHTFSLRTSNQSPQYNLMFIDYPASLDLGDVKSIFDAVRDDGVKAVNGKLLGEREDTSVGHPGRFYKVLTKDEGVMLIKTFLVKNRFYNLSYTTGEKSKGGEVSNLHQEAASRFLNSFRLLTEQELAAFEGEVDRLLRELREKGEPVYGQCSDDKNCKSIPNSTLELGESINKPPPVYPPIAKAARAQGEVRVQVVVDEEGKVIAAQALSGHPLLQAAAVKAARHVLHKPALLNGKPVKITGVLSYNFNLQ